MAFSVGAPVNVPPGRQQQETQRGGENERDETARWSYGASVK
jgi:hypothetical protein